MLKFVPTAPFSASLILLPFQLYFLLFLNILEVTLSLLQFNMYQRLSCRNELLTVSNVRPEDGNRNVVETLKNLPTSEV